MSNTHGMPDALGVLTAMEDARATDNPMVALTVYDGEDAFQAFANDLDRGQDSVVESFTNPNDAAAWLTRSVDPFAFYVVHLDDVADLRLDETMTLRYGNDPDLRLAVCNTPPPADPTRKDGA